MKKFIYNKAFAIASALLCLGLLLCFASCAKKTPEGEKQDFASQSLSELEKYATLGEYKGLEISVGDKTRGDAVWERVCAGMTVYEYPEAHVSYYASQLTAEYEYHAEKSGIKYKELLKSLGIDKNDIIEEAQELTKSDLAYALVLKAEGISLTEDEKAAHFEKYVSKYVLELGYSEEHVRNNMTDSIYESMLYDKTTEFLIVNNKLN